MSTASASRSRGTPSNGPLRRSGHSSAPAARSPHTHVMRRVSRWRASYLTGTLTDIVPARSPATALARERPQDDKTRAGVPNCALAMARLLNRTRFSDLPPMAVEHAKILVASTLASAAAGSTYSSARIIRDLAKEHGG